MPYFQRLDDHRFRATDLVGGAWRDDEQHIAPALGLLTHLVETDRDARRDDGLVIARLSFDILGTMAVDAVATSVRVLRPGRTIELVEAVMSQSGRPAVMLRAWLMEQRDTSGVEGSTLTAIPGPDDVEPWSPGEVWSSGFVNSVEVRRRHAEPGRAAVWVRTDVPLLESEPISALSRATGLLDLANGMSVREDPHKVHFPNLDLTVNWFREPEGEWIGFDTSVSFGPRGVGLTSTVLHDEHGPVGTMGQVLTVRPR